MHQIIQIIIHATMNLHSNTAVVIIVFHEFVNEKWTIPPTNTT
jgi:hypothetical protein